MAISGQGEAVIIFRLVVAIGLQERLAGLLQPAQGLLRGARVRDLPAGDASVELIDPPVELAGLGFVHGTRAGSGEPLGRGGGRRSHRCLSFFRGLHRCLGGKRDRAHGLGLQQTRDPQRPHRRFRDDLNPLRSRRRGLPAPGGGSGLGKRRGPHGRRPRRFHGQETKAVSVSPPCGSRRGKVLLGIPIPGPGGPGFHIRGRWRFRHRRGRGGFGRRTRNRRLWRGRGRLRRLYPLDEASEQRPPFSAQRDL
jgi:hypothetical protein